MKKVAINLLIKGLTIFEALIVSKIPSEWVKQTVRLLSERLKLFGQALTDTDPNNAAQVERIAKETLMSPKFAELEKLLTVQLASKIKNETLRNLILTTDDLRVNLFAVLGDNDPANEAQARAVFEAYVRSENFDTSVLSLVEMFLAKHAKNELVKTIIMELFTELVNADDQV